MNFFNRSNHPVKKEKTPAGSEVITTYIVELDENGNKKEVPNGKLNIYDQIQSHHEGTKIQNIIRRAQGGDPTALAQTHGEYMDVTEAPTSLAAVHNVVMKAQDDFYSFPAELRREFNNNPETYIKSIGTEEWANIIGKFYRSRERTENTAGATANQTAN